MKAWKALTLIFLPLFFLPPCAIPYTAASFRKQMLSLAILFLSLGSPEVSVCWTLSLQLHVPKPCAWLTWCLSLYLSWAENVWFSIGGYTGDVQGMQCAYQTSTISQSEIAVHAKLPAFHFAHFKRYLYDFELQFPSHSMFAHWLLQYVILLHPVVCWMN